MNIEKFKQYTVFYEYLNNTKKPEIKISRIFGVEHNPLLRLILQDKNKKSEFMKIEDIAQKIKEYQFTEKYSEAYNIAKDLIKERIEDAFFVRYFKNDKDEIKLLTKESQIKENELLYRLELFKYIDFLEEQK